MDNVESDYSCANASEDLHRLTNQLRELESDPSGSRATEEHRNRIRNQIEFIRNKCHIH